MNPFASYPKWGEVDPLPVRGMTTCRTGYAARLQQLTGQTSCAYCGMDLVDTFEHWLLVSVDHVIPQNVATKDASWGKWVHNLYNTVLCCSACNGFLNRFRLPLNAQAPATFDEFCRIRDEVFETRRKRLEKRWTEERAAYDSKPWQARP